MALLLLLASFSSLVCATSVFEPVLPNRSVVLPRDFAFHPEYQHEWWNYFARLRDKNGTIYHVQWRYVRLATDEREMRGWQSPQVYLSHVVVSKGSKVWREQKVARGGIGQAGLVSKPFRLWIDNWSWRSLGAMPFPGSIDIATDSFGVELDTVTSGPLVLNGKRGYQVKHTLQSVASYSFSAPFLKVNGRLILDGKEIPVVGSAWTQKEWGSGLFGDEQQGLDWFVFNLDDGRALTVSRYRYLGQLPSVFGTLSTRSGKTINLTDKQLSLIALDSTSLPNGRRLPLKWKINIPEYNISLTTRVRNQNMWLPFLVPLWEGPALASGSHEAWGFMQLNGY
ncbi:lipocalin-like domain-containing protein [Vibrio sp. CAU 1672]|uniref:lipocalin-like domain-containing protein n=1 Tax=Vibrio sp. CAU 1672 TaxID=3032594 RepID=UPI0023DA5A13|nr:lipocalin-like domain-containing protein [Vibrio sp. CAU 1672]MDF2152397.1 lipocalin-like domain-containing protein [Vibrio sp. CAU 1672]